MPKATRVESQSECSDMNSTKAKREADPKQEKKCDPRKIQRSTIAINQEVKVKAEAKATRECEPTELRNEQTRRSASRPRALK